ncbi:GNAT family N-acetyltransferase [Eubacteriales bacterium OttesenSCG-928-M02]|nr:GNAT family N-acetyltransferase [Eubacteriales bacterium OttesenSCG-928-M02]
MALIRPAFPEDVTAISQIHAASWRHAYRGIIPQAYLDTLAENQWVPALTNGLKYEGMRAYLSIQKGQAVGAITLGPGRKEIAGAPEEDSWGEIYSVYILPSHTGKGQGRALISHALSVLRDMGFSRCYLWVAADNTPAIGFYQHMGFSADGITHDFPIMGEAISELRLSIKL